MNSKEIMAEPSAVLNPSWQIENIPLFHHKNDIGIHENNNRIHENDIRILENGVRIKRNPAKNFDLPESFSWDTIFPSTPDSQSQFPKNVRKKGKRRRRIRKKGLRAQGSDPEPYRVAKTTPKPSAIFFPTNEDEGCAEATAVGSGFNTFGFMGRKFKVE